MADSTKDTVEEKTTADHEVLQKYKAAGDIVNKTIQLLLKEIKAGASVKTLCEKGDKNIEVEASKKYKNTKDIKKGVAFPVCLSVNNCICHFSPSKNDPDYELKDGDVVKLDLGAHIDGFIAVAAYTVVVGATPENKVKGRKADVILAAHNASQAAIRLLKHGNGNYAVTDAVQKISEVYKCKPIEGMLSHQLKQNKMDGEKTIIQNPTAAQRKEHEKCEMEHYEVYAMDVLVSTGEGQGKELDTKVTIYKKTDENYLLKLKASKNFYAEVKQKYGNMPFNLRYFEEEAKAKMGVVECVAHKLIEPFQVLYEKKTEFVAQFKHTCLLLPNGLCMVTGFPFDESLYESEHSIPDGEVKDLVTAELKLVDGPEPAKDKKPKKPKKGKENAAAAPAAAEKKA
ncbi:proliferation-associated protein 2G4 [Culicoides brevitarsis]|uniref:proliferation-associated protein 2G4 n=1 Tax=Culicoides brevitarsis TaxID=469753 RepID=UPI00307B25A6